MVELKPEKLTVLCAQNEQCKWDFTGYGAQVCDSNLGKGGADYTLLGFENVLRIERKEINDYLASITRGRDRFERQLKFMRQFAYRAVIVEWPSLPGLLDALGRGGGERDGRIHSGAHWNSVRGSTLHLSRRWCPIIFAGTREEAQDYAWDFMFGVAEDWWKTFSAIGGIAS